MMRKPSPTSQLIEAPVATSPSPARWTLARQAQVIKYFLICFSLIGQAYAEPWDTTDKLLGIAAVTALIVDWGQTRYIAKHPEQFSESNILLGKHPSIGKVNTYFTGAIIGTLVAGNYLSSRNRKILFGTITAVEVIVTSHNRNIGVKISF
jgi:hypothetical protein